MTSKTGSETEWRLVAPFMPTPAVTGRPWLWPLRLIFDGVLYVLRIGCAWEHLPPEFPPQGTVHRWFLRLARSGVFECMAHVLVMTDRERSGREASPTAAVVDAQAARSGTVGVAGSRGFDPARRVVGRKRHTIVNTHGRWLVAAVSPASLHDSHGRGRCTGDLPSHGSHAHETETPVPVRGTDRVSAVTDIIPMVEAGSAGLALEVTDIITKVGETGPPKLLESHRG